MTEFEVINRFVDVDVYGALCAYIRSNVFDDVDGTLSDFMSTILVYLFCGLYIYMEFYTMDLFTLHLLPYFTKLRNQSHT